MWDDDIEVNGDDLMDNFTIPNLASLFDFNQSNLLTVNRTEGISTVTLEFYNLTINPMTCNAGGELIVNSSSLVSPGISCD